MTAVESDNWDAAQRLLEAIARDPDNVQRVSKIVGDDAKAHEILLTLVREQSNMAKVGAWLEERIALAIQQANYRQAEWNNAVMSCGHVRKYRVPTGSVEEFVVDAEQHGKCVVCAAIEEAATVKETTKPQPCAHNWLESTDLIDRAQHRLSFECGLCGARKQERVPCLAATDVLD